MCGRARSTSADQGHKVSSSDHSAGFAPPSLLTRKTACEDCTHLVAPGRLEPAEHIRPAPGGAGQPGVDEVPLKGAVGGRPALRGPQDPLDLRGRAGRVLPLERGRSSTSGGVRGTALRGSGTSAANPPLR